MVVSPALTLLALAPPPPPHPPKPSTAGSHANAPRGLLSQKFQARDDLKGLTGQLQLSHSVMTSRLVPYEVGHLRKCTKAES